MTQLEAAVRPVTATRAAPGRRWSRDMWLGYALIFPALIAILALVAYPTVYAIWMSFHQKLLGGANVPYVGWENYVTVLSGDLFWPSLNRTIFYTVVSVAIKLVVGLITALVLNETWRGRGLVRAAVLLPWALPPLTAVLTWRFLLSDSSNVLNYMLRQAGLISRQLPWLYDPEWAMASVILVNVWRGFPFFAITLLAGLATVGHDLYDAAKVDGAGTLQRFWNVTVPGIFPVLLVSTTLSSIWTANEFAGIWLLTTGGPGTATATLGLTSYLVGFVQGARNMSQAAVYSILTFPILIALVVVLSRAVAAREEETA
jgi:ABC-type sugar transport system permease subunit